MWAQKNVDFIRLRSFLVSPNTFNNHIRVKAHVKRREHPCFYSWLFFLILAKFGKNKIQADASLSITSNLLCLCHE